MGAPPKRALVAVALEQNKPEEMFGRLGQTFLPFAIHFSNKKKRPVAVLGEARPVNPD